jgi:hypothetical protein
MSRKLIFCIVLGIAVVAQAGSYSDAVTADSPLVYYQFEDATSGDGDTAADTMSFNNAAYISDGNTLADVTLSANNWAGSGGQLGNAATFYGTSVNGNGTAVAIGGGNASGLELTTMSVEFMVNAPYNADTYQRMYSHKDGYGDEPRPEVFGGLGDARQIAMTGPNGVYYTDYTESPVFDEAWHHVVAIWSNDSGDTTMSWYFDGEFQGSQVQGEAVLNYDDLAEWSNPLIGSNGNPGWLYNGFEGTLDEVAIYDYVLSEERIEAHYNAIPEPMTIALLGLGGLLLRRRKR